jgi:cysteine-rich repeat protein
MTIKFFSVVLILLIGINFVYGEEMPNVNYSCQDSRFSEYDVQSCDECFIGQKPFYHGRSYTLNYGYKNSSSSKNTYHKPGEYSITYENLQGTKILFEFPTAESMFYSQEASKYFFKFGELGTLFKFKPNDSARLIETSTISPLKLSTVTTLANPNRFGLKITYDFIYHYADRGDSPDLTEQNHYKTCIFDNISYCGDGILQNQYGEKCDIGAKNGTSGSSCSATCQP